MQDYKRLTGCTLVRFFIVLTLLFPAVVLAADVSDVKLVNENPQLFNWMFGICVLILGWFMVRTVQKLDANNLRVWETLDKIVNRLATLEGTCRARQESLSGGRRSYDPDERNQC